MDTAADLLSDVFPETIQFTAGFPISRTAAPGRVLLYAALKFTLGEYPLSGEKRRLTPAQMDSVYKIKSGLQQFIPADTVSNSPVI